MHYVLQKRKKLKEEELAAKIMRRDESQQSFMTRAHFGLLSVAESIKKGINCTQKAFSTDDLSKNTLSII